MSSSSGRRVNFIRRRGRQVGRESSLRGIAAGALRVGCPRVVVTETSRGAGCRHVAPSPRDYSRRRPETTVLHKVVRDNLETLLAECSSRSASGLGYPAHVEAEFRRYLDCGVLSRGFVKVHCASCNQDELCAFSCKGRAVCPSCAGRRMSDTAARLVDERLPSFAGYRQWVFSFPWRLRVPLARDPTLLAEVFQLCIRKVFAHQRKKAKAQGIAPAECKSLAVLFVQRFGSLLQLNPHGHSVVADGVFVRTDDGDLRYVELEPPTDAEVEAVGVAIARGLERIVARRAEMSDADDDEDAAMDHALSEAASPRRASRPPSGDAQRKRTPRSALIQTELGMVSIHAATQVGAGDSAGLERLLKYCGRPAFAQNRLSLLSGGRVRYKLRKPYFTGQTEVVLEPVAFLRRLAALVPPARQNQVRYFGLLTSQAADRPAFLRLCSGSGERDSSSEVAGAVDPDDELPGNRMSYRMSWARLLSRVFSHDILVCPGCGGDRQIVAAVIDHDAIVRVLTHLDLPTDDYPVAPARSPPQTQMWDEGFE